MTSTQLMLLSQLADLKLQQYEELLLLSSLIELLDEKGLLTPAELAAKRQALDRAALPSQAAGAGHNLVHLI